MTQPTPLMPHATASWLVDTTALTFEQIAEFCGLHILEVQAMADDLASSKYTGRDPVRAGELTMAEIERGQADPTYALKMQKAPVNVSRTKGPRYTPVSKRNDKPDAIAYLLKQHPELKDSQICKLVGTTKPTIAAIRDRSHPNSANIRPRHPAEIGLCTFEELDKASRRSLKAMGKDPDAEAARRAEEAAQAYESANPESEEKKLNKFDFSNFLKSAS